MVPTNLYALSDTHALLTTLNLPPTNPIPENTSQHVMRIQQARPDDLEAIQRLLSTLDLPHSDLTASHLQHFLVCRNNTASAPLVGVVGLELYGRVALLRSLAVRPSHRSRGIGARLTERIERYGQENGVDELYLLTTTASEYFGQHSYETTEREELPTAIQQTEEAAQLCPASATCMRKKLPA